MLKIGDIAPDFSMFDDAEKLVSLDELLSDGELILYFYPADFTPVCTQEACAIRDIHDEVLDVDIRVVGVSPQSATSHAKFKTKFDLPFPLLFDEGKKVIKAFGVDGLFGVGVRRATYLIGQDKVIKNRVVSDLFAASHVKFIKQIVKQA